MILSNQEKTGKLCSTKIVALHMSKTCPVRGAAAARC